MRAAMRLRSPLLMCVTQELLKRGALGLADSMRLERMLMRRAFEHGEVLEAIRAQVTDEDHQPQWTAPALTQ